MAFLPLITLISLVALRDLLPLLTMTGQALRRAPKIAATAMLIADSTAYNKARFNSRCMQQILTSTLSIKTTSLYFFRP